jgi:putative endonuclease
MRRNPEHIIAVYMMSNQRDGVIYTGVSANLAERVRQHRDGAIVGFTQTYRCKTLVWWQRHWLIVEAIQREKTIKHYSRQWKVNLIEADNPDWLDLWNDISQPVL